MIRPTLRQLEYLVAVADCGSFGEASRRCGVTQPGLSSQIRQLEDLLELRLLERVRPRAVPTAAGAELVERARRVMLETDDLVAAALTHQKPLHGPLRLGVIPTLAPYLLPRVLPAVRREFPELRLLIREDPTGALLELLAAAEIDLLLLA
ncbi:MAG: LysR family transcriptional regulator, partial [Proteobacteria bacterium]|nr:LysR family transcriptional regulator [Pseudomonadota bacterium]